MGGTMPPLPGSDSPASTVTLVMINFPNGQQQLNFYLASWVVRNVTLSLGTTNIYLLDTRKFQNSCIITLVQWGETVSEEAFLFYFAVSHAIYKNLYQGLYSQKSREKWMKIRILLQKIFQIVIPELACIVSLLWLLIFSGVIL